MTFDQAVSTIGKQVSYNNATVCIIEVAIISLKKDTGLGHQINFFYKIQTSCCFFKLTALMTKHDLNWKHTTICLCGTLSLCVCLCELWFSMDLNWTTGNPYRENEKAHYRELFILFVKTWKHTERTERTECAALLVTAQNNPHLLVFLGIWRNCSHWKRPVQIDSPPLLVY